MPGIGIGISPQFGGARGLDPSSIYGSDLKLWLRADTGITLNGGDVAAWANAGALGGSFDQGTPANQPLWTESDANLNGMPSVTFTAANSDNLQSTLAASAGNFLHDGTGCTVFAVVRVATSGNMCILGSRTTAGASRGAIIQHAGASNAFQLLISDGATNVVNLIGSSNAAEPLSCAVMFTHATADTPDCALHYNPTTSSRGTASGTPSASNAAAAMRVGATAAPANFLNGSVAEIIAAVGVDATKIASIQAYLLARYGFQ